ncbi:MAG: hypothetical protein ACE5EQ_06035, partial [Phycisphaerae bacterium]
RSALPLPSAAAETTNGNAMTGLNDYRLANLDGVQCVTCHTLPTGVGPDGTFVGFPPVFQPIPPGPNGERHHAIVSVDGSTNVSMKIPHLRNLYEKVGFDLTQQTNTAGFGFLHDGSIDSIARFVNEPVFNLVSDQQTADMVAFMLAFTGSNLPLGSPNNPLEPPGPTSQDTPAAVGWQTTLVDAGTPAPGQLALIADMIAQAEAGTVGLVVKGNQAGLHRGYTYTGAGRFQSDRVTEFHTAAQLQALAAPGSELTYTVVPIGSQIRIGVDRDLDGFFDRDEIDACSNPANAASIPGAPGVDIDGDLDEDFDDVTAFVAVLLDPALNPAHATRSDMNCDTVVDGGDVQLFVDAFLTP